MSQNGPTYIIWNLTKNGSLLPKITHICGKETKFQNRIDTPAAVLETLEQVVQLLQLGHQVVHVLHDGLVLPVLR